MQINIDSVCGHEKKKKKRFEKCYNINGYIVHRQIIMSQSQRHERSILFLFPTFYHFYPHIYLWMYFIWNIIMDDFSIFFYFFFFVFYKTYHLSTDILICRYINMGQSIDVIIIINCQYLCMFFNAMSLQGSLLSNLHMLVNHLFILLMYRSK